MFKMNILITGGYGFIGSAVVNMIFKEVDTLVVLDRIDYNSSELNVDENIRNHSSYHFIQGDLCDLILMESILTQYHINMIIHLAAQTHVDISFTNSLQFTKDNVLGTHTLLEAVKNYGHIKKIIIMSSDEIYGEVSHDELNPCHEKSLLDPTNPYSATKAAAEFLVKSYGYSYHLPYIIIRGNNVYGPKQYPDKLIPKFITLLKQDLPLTIHGNGSSKRTFVYIDDMASGILTVMKYGNIGEIYNIGSENEYSVMDIARLLCDKMGKPFNLEYVKDRNFNDKRYFINYNKVLELGWKEKMSFNDGINNTINWY